MQLEAADDGVDVFGDRRVEAHEIVVGVREDGAARREPEEQRGTTSEWLVVAIETLGHAREQFWEELRLTADPLHDRRRDNFLDLLRDANCSQFATRCTPRAMSHKSNRRGAEDRGPIFERELRHFDNCAFISSARCIVIV
jgi:hypothetical protein